MTIKNIILRQLFKVLNSLPKGTKKIDIEYTDSEDEQKITIYPSTEDEDEEDTPTRNNISDPNISPDEDLMNLI